MSMNRQDAINRLQQGMCTLTYNNEQGQAQTRKGTLNQSQIPQQKQSQAASANSQSSGNTITYFDTDQGDFRSFSLDRLQDIQSS